MKIKSINSKCPECGSPLSWHRVLKSEGYEANGWQLDTTGNNCETCEEADDRCSYIYDTQKEALKNWSW